MAMKKKPTKGTTSSKKPGRASRSASPPEPADESPAVPADAAPVQNGPEPGPPVAGVGASAGGLDAFMKLLAAMPPNSGIALVLVPHLDPGHESLMVELLARRTAMPVVEVKDDMRVEANHVFVIPPNKYMTIRGGVLRLRGPVERRVSQTAIDLFLRSLAEDQQERSICIILSGTGSHGTLGLKDVKAAGGMAMVQDPVTADYKAMPQSAIATGLADYVLPVERMPEALVKYVRHGYVDGGKSGAEPAETPDHLSQVLALVRGQTKLDFRPYRKKMLARRLSRRMSLSQIDRSDAYLAFLREHPDEVKLLSRDLLISVTSFFRDPDAWRSLETEVIAPLVRVKQPDAPVRVWSVGCATGEEPYSLGMMLLEQLAAAQKHCPVQIFATDVDDDALEVARRATYPESIAADVSPKRLARFFTRVSDSAYQVSKQLRETVNFARQNLLADAPFSKLDLVVCRNLLIYLEPEIQRKVIALLHFALSEGGFLFLGSSETIGRNVDLFEPIAANRRIYRRIGPTRVDNLHLPVTELELHQARAQPTKNPQPPARLAEMAQNFLLRRYALACVVINRNYEVLHFAGPTEDYLVQPGGPPTHDLLALARPGIESNLRLVIQRAIRQNLAQSVHDVMMRHTGVTRRVNIDVEPLNLTKQTEGFLLISFQEQPNPAGETLAEAKARTRVADSDMVRQLEQQLETTREDLQSTIEEMESSNEELKSANEEIMSANEEIQSANEELETSKEELQSVNEELTTVNSQLHAKVQELVAVNTDMVNLFNCTEIATLFLDSGFRIKRFTPATTRLFNLIATDVGRPIGDIVKRFSDDDLLADAQQLLRDLTPREKEVRTEDGRWCARRIFPYRTLDNRVDGVVMTFVDVTERKTAADAVVRRLAAIVKCSADAIFSKDLDGTLRTWNQGAERLFGYRPDEAVGQSARMLVPDDRVAEWDGVRARLARGENFEQLETERVCKDGQRIPVELTYSPLLDENGKIVGASGTARNLSERKRAEEELRASEQKFRLMADAAPVLIWMSSADRLCTWFNKPWLEFVGRPMEKELGDGWTENIHADDFDGCVRTFHAAFDARQPFTMEYRLKRHDGEYRWVLDNGNPTYGAGAEFTGYIGCCIDITDRKRDEEEARRLTAELHAKVEELTTLLDIIPVGVLMADPQCRRITANRTFYVMLRLAPPGGNLSLTAEQLDMPSGIHVCRDGRELPPDEFPMQATGRTGRRIVDFDHDIVFPDGWVMTLLANTAPLLDEHGAVRGVVGAYTDITERKRAESALRDREARLAAILDTAADAIITVDDVGIIQSVNRAAERTFGYTAAEMIGQNVSLLMAPPDRDAHEGYMARYRQTREKHIIGTTREVQARRKDGSVFPTELAVNEVEHLKLFTGIHRDLTERKQLERDVVEAASLEQRRIGQDLHDSVAQELTALNLLAKDLAETHLTDPATITPLAEQLAQGLQRSQQELRAVLRGLLPVAVDSGGLMASLSDLADRTQKERKADCTFECPEPVTVADNLTATQLYFIAQEAVHNAVRHAQAQNIRITLNLADACLVLRVQDDGIGMRAQPAEYKGLGLRIMGNRAAILGARLTIEPATPTGTVVTCALEKKNDGQEKTRETGQGANRR